MFLQALHISKRYRVGNGYTYALKDASLSFPDTGMVAIFGPSGSGKTTLLNLLSGLDIPSSGRVLLRGKPIVRGQDCALVFQHYNLIEGASVFRNVALACSIQGMNRMNAVVKEALREVGLSGFERRNVDTLSGGEKQRVAIARAIVTEPSFLCADEPTGALDQEHAEAIMKLLKRISRKRLVIFVSHHADFVSRYADQVVEVKSGRVLCKGTWMKKRAPMREAKRKRGHGWCSFFLKRNLSRHWLKNTACLISGTIGFLSLMLTLGFYGGHIPALEREGKRLLHYQSAYLSEKERVEIPSSPLTLVREARPKYLTALDLTEGIYGLSFETDLSYFFPSSLPYEFLGKTQEPIRFTPIADLTLREGNAELLLEGTLPKDNTMDEALVNREFATMFPGTVVGKKIHVEAKSQIQRLDATETVFLSFDFTIAGVVEEFRFLNSPRLYYSYLGLWNHLADYELSAFGRIGHLRYTVTDFLEDCPNDSPYLKYRYLVFSHDFGETEKLLAKSGEWEGTSYSLESEAYSLRESFRSIAEAFGSSLALVSAISLAGLLAILMMMAYSNFTEKKKEAAVLLSLGASSGDLTAIFAWESCVVSLLAMIAALVFTLPLVRFGNSYLSVNFGIQGIIDHPWAIGAMPPLGFIALCLVASGAFGFASGALPILCSKRIPLAEELRDE
ncbi:MAG: ABC transporter ATP-binding protein/permease [Bacilli bacterium]|nr:ABC transporter ATP-binding protein/permease [Bacilli bacterium]